MDIMYDSRVMIYEEQELRLISQILHVVYISPLPMTERRRVQVQRTGKIHMNTMIIVIRFRKVLRIQFQ